MANFENISIQPRQQRQTITPGRFFGMSFMQSDWGNINLPTDVTDVDDFVDKFGMYNDDNKNDWFQIYNFLQYSRNLRIFRLGWTENYPTFDGATSNLSTIYGSSNSHIFLNSITHTERVSPWNETDNGSNVYIKYSDFSGFKNVPTYLATYQHIFIAAKYCGSRGNDIGVTIANVNTDLDNSYVFKHTELFVGDSSGISLGDVVIGDTSGSYGTVVQKHSSLDIVYVDMGSLSSFTAGENINSGLTNIVSFNESDDVDSNYTLRDLFKRTIKKHEIGIVITLENEIVEYGVYSLSYNDKNYILSENFNWVDIHVNDNWVDPRTLDLVADQNNNIISEITNEKLNFGVSTFLPEPIGSSQLDLLKSPYFADFSILFTETINYDLILKLKEVCNERNDFILIFNRIDDIIDISYLVDMSYNYLFDGTSFLVSGTTTITTEPDVDDSSNRSLPANGYGSILLVRS